MKNWLTFLPAPQWSLAVLQLKLCRHFRLQRDGEIPTRRASALELLLPAVQLGSFPLQLLLLPQQVGLGRGGGRLETHKHGRRHSCQGFTMRSDGSLKRRPVKTPLSVRFKWKHLTSCLSFMFVSVRSDGAAHSLRHGNRVSDACRCVTFTMRA